MVQYKELYFTQNFSFILNILKIYILKYLIYTYSLN